MSLLSTLDKRISDLRARRVKQEKLVSDLTRPISDLDALRQQEAEALEAKDAAEAEREQLQAERGDLQRYVDHAAPLEKQAPTLLAGLTLAEQIAVGDSSIYSRARWQITNDIDTLNTRRTTLASIDARLKELEG